MKKILYGCLIFTFLILQSCNNDEETPLLDASYEVTPITCNSNGKVDLTVIGGIAPYDFLWSDQTTSEDLENITMEGFYSVVITDSEGRAKVISQIEVTRPPFEIFIDDNISPSDLSQNNGAIDLSITGGVPPYSFLWSDGQTTETISDLSPGTYTVDITDSNQCTAYAEFEVEEKGILIDERDGNEYEIRKNGSQVWMYDGLRFVTSSGSSFKFDDEQYSDEARYYKWQTAMNNEVGSDTTPSNVRGLCPEGWHLPSPDEWLIFQSFLESEKESKGNSFRINDYINWPSGTFWGPQELGQPLSWYYNGDQTYYITSKEIYLYSLLAQPGHFFYFSFKTARAGEYQSLCHCIKN